MLQSCPSVGKTAALRATHRDLKVAAQLGRAWRAHVAPLLAANARTLTAERRLQRIESFTRCSSSLWWSRLWSGWVVVISRLFRFLVGVSFAVCCLLFMLFMQLARSTLVDP